MIDTCTIALGFGRNFLPEKVLKSPNVRQLFLVFASSKCRANEQYLVLLLDLFANFSVSASWNGRAVARIRFVHIAIRPLLHDACTQMVCCKAIDVLGRIVYTPAQ